MVSRLLLVLCLVVTPLTKAEDEPQKRNNKTAALKFLRTNVFGSSFETSWTKAIDNGKVKSSFKSTTTFTGLAETDRGFSFEKVISIEQTLQDLDASGKLTGEPQKKDRVLVVRNYIGESRSTGELIGYSTIDVNTGVDSFPYSAKALRMRLDGEQLVLEQDTVLYDDLFAKDGKFRSGAVRTIDRFEVTDGATKIRTKITGYDVNPNSLERVVSDDLEETISTTIER